jgi:HlyD family secretion protein
MSMSKRNLAIVAALAVAASAGAMALFVPDGDGFSPASQAAFAQQNEKRWLAVAPGRVEPPSGIIKVAAPTIGVVSKVLVKAGDTVFAGEPMILLNDDDVQARYMAAESSAAMRKRLRDEQSVTGKAADRRRAEDAIAAAETAVFEAQAAVDSAAIEARTNGGSGVELADARAALTRAKNELANRQNAYRGIDAPLPTPNEAQTVSARGDLAFTRANLEKLKIRAPIDGTVLQVNIHAGELAAPTALQPVLLIANLSTLNVRAELDERDVAEIKVGQAVSIRAPAYADKEFAGTVASIAPLVEPSRLTSRATGSRTDVDAVEVLVKLAQPGPLTTGMKVDVYFAPPEQAAENKTGK